MFLMIFSFSGPWVPTLKAGMEIVTGIVMGPPVLPQRPLTVDARERIQNKLKSLGLCQQPYKRNLTCLRTLKRNPCILLPTEYYTKIIYIYLNVHLLVLFFYRLLVIFILFLAYFIYRFLGGFLSLRYLKLFSLLALFHDFFI